MLVCDAIVEALHQFISISGHPLSLCTWSRKEKILSRIFFSLDFEVCTVVVLGNFSPVETIRKTSAN